MDDFTQIYLIAYFPQLSALEQAARQLLASGTAHNHLVLLADGVQGAESVAESLGIRTELNSDIDLDAEQSQQMAWHRERNSGPMLAVQTQAVDGRDLRLRLTQLGGKMLWDTDVNVQIDDVAVDPDTPIAAPDEPSVSDHKTPAQSLDRERKDPI
jgi:hypothetical protein